jgi:hypothetical protein
MNYLVNIPNVGIFWIPVKEFITMFIKTTDKTVVLKCDVELTRITKYPRLAYGTSLTPIQFAGYVLLEKRSELLPSEVIE